jgi:hypothetical protein
MRFDGRCHCGNLEVAFHTERPPDATPLRECGCSFCRRHGNTSVTDPAGRLEVRARDAAEVSRYQFGLRTSEFLICRTCGVFVAAICEIDGETYGTLNCNVLEARGAFTQAPARVDYDGEVVADRLARRRRGWTPAVVAGLAG